MAGKRGAAAVAGIGMCCALLVLTNGWRLHDGNVSA
jgi:hypothetical protein